MTEASKDPAINQDVIRQMRILAGQGATVRALVHVVQTALRLKPDALLLPLLWYLMQAFHVSLPAVLPVREWLGTTRDDEINAQILPAIERTRDRWMAELARGYNGSAAAGEPGPAAAEQRS